MLYPNTDFRSKIETKSLLRPTQTVNIAAFVLIGCGVGFGVTFGGSGDKVVDSITIGGSDNMAFKHQKHFEW